MNSTVTDVTGLCARAGRRRAAVRAERCRCAPCPLHSDHVENSRAAARHTGLAPPILSLVGISFRRPLRLAIAVGRRNWGLIGRITGVIKVARIAGNPTPIVIQV